MTFYDRFRTSVLEKGLLYHLGMTANAASTEPETGGGSLLSGMKGGQQKDGKLLPGQAPPSPKRKKRRPPARKARKGPPPAPQQCMELVGTTSRMVTQELQQLDDGFGMTMIQNICDNSEALQGKEPDSFFLVRHMLNLDGPAGSAQTGGSRGYQVAFEAAARDDFMLSATWQGPMMMGAIEKHLSKNITCSTNFELTNSKIPQLASMFPAYSASIDCKSQDRTARLHCSKNPYLPGQQWSLSLMNKVFNGFSVGAKVGANFQLRSTSFSVAAKYRAMAKNNGVETFEALVNVNEGTLKAWYTRSIAWHTTLTSGVEVNPWKRLAVGSFGYRYVFGSRMGPQLVGSINSKMQFKQALTIPVLENMMFRIHGQMNHASHNPRQLVFPNSFGMSIIMQM